jgi:pectinesterase
VQPGQRRVAPVGYNPAVTRGWVAAAIAVVSIVPASHPHAAAQQVRHVTIVLAGDSTVTDDSGWGLGFKQLVSDAATVVNTAANGRSSKSFIDEGRWKIAVALRGDYYLIQFGHNDQPGKGPERETDPATTYPQNLARFVDDVRAIGGTPILVTSLTRRTFDASGTHIVSTLGPWVAAARRVAAEKRAALIDLDATSAAMSERLGRDALVPLSARTATGEVDTTHLNAAGSLAFGRLVVGELRRVVPALAPYLRDRPVAAEAVRMWRAPDAVVAADGSGQYKTVQEAINAAPQTTSAANRWTILVKAGTYREVVYVQREKRFISIVGEDPARTTITYDLRASAIGLDGQPIGTFRTPTVTVDADDFSIENLTIENAAGPVGQALALRIDGDRIVVRNSRLLGWQDTLFVNRGRQYFEDSLIAGHVDFIFGGATAFFERCRLHVWQNGYLTAASTPPEQPFGFVFANGSITGDTDVKAYLGRPWRDYAQVTFLNTEMSDVIRPVGWHNWDRPEREKTARYAEFGSRGGGAPAAGARVSWAKALSRAEAAAMSVDRVLSGTDGWDPRRVPAHPVAGLALGSLPRAPGRQPSGVLTAQDRATLPFP